MIDGSKYYVHSFSFIFFFPLFSFLCVLLLLFIDFVSIPSPLKLLLTLILIDFGSLFFPNWAHRAKILTVIKGTVVSTTNKSIAGTSSINIECL